jgi:DNA ligase-1
MAANSSTNAKKDILRKYADNPFLVKILQYTYHPLKQYFVTSKGLEKNKDMVADQSYPVLFTDIFTLLDALNARQITGHDAIAHVNYYISIDPSTRDIVYQIIDKNLKTRATATIINEIIPNCIPVFEVQLAERYDEYLEKHEKENAKIAEALLKGKKIKERKYALDFEDDMWLESTKLDGCRCVAVVDADGVCEFFSRSGKSFETLGKVKAEIEALGFRNVVFDGEICLRTEDDKDDFQGVMKEIQRKDHTIERPLYYLFDFMPLDVFMNPDSPMNVVFTQRLAALDAVFFGRTQTYTAILKQNVVKSLEYIEQRKQEVIAAGREGLIMKRNTKYQQGRTNDILKVKAFFDAEYEVISTSNEVQRVVRDGHEEEIEMMKNVQIVHKGSIVDIGSGWDQAERMEYYEHPENIIGKIITVQYQMESIDQHGKPSLRFPTVKIVHGKERTI